ncbi:MAG: phosphopyruvate hydratase [Actinobacteria bacterium]|uniref:phosphopyruvate hydratase n=1 Tax=freshwater metagenome TaxID=449393 RepID=A0A6J6WD71_9ZZZZ|nr:phosphopyruvate hydratase [Actinomycetota bacterium]MSY67953.1 phosphopyruvate hydratase [Actinomycetota bacterium]MSZ58797.1 phosphopyruvate hydratase [Actinomycetota bacterium]MTA01086.1 phosphopyruvate hydratase [Actinomycetota bacterium]MTB26666.1 phosphopyruvate hydratase [Actinomycetota bacterium]
MSAISKIDLWQVLDSRGMPTVSARVSLGNKSANAIAPSGASTGAHEALFLRDNKESYDGKSVSETIALFTKEVLPHLIGIDGNDFAELDKNLRNYDSSRTFSKFGGHIPVAITIAAWLANAKEKNAEPFKVIADRLNSTPTLPLPMVNIFSGGAHAGGAIDLQDILAVPIGATSIEEAMEWVWLVRESTKSLLSKSGHDQSLVADEGGVTARLQSDEQALQFVSDGIAKAGLSGKVAIALDIAATQSFQGDHYQIHESGNIKKLSSEQFVSRWGKWLDIYPIISVEDGAAEDDNDGWKQQSEYCDRIQIIGDDRYATQNDRLVSGIANLEANTILIKPNQAGTLHSALTALTTAKGSNWGTVVSARSGDTEESWLVDLAVGSNAGQIKVGSTHRSERSAKWNRLLELSHFATASYIGKAALSHVKNLNI